MITNISDRKDTSFLSNNKLLSSKIMFSLLKMVFSSILNSIFISFWSVAAFRNIGKRAKNIFLFCSFKKMLYLCKVLSLK